MNANDLAALLPAHKCGLYLEHNAHRDVYQSAADLIAEQQYDGWKNQEAIQRAIATDEIWELQWYPETPVVFTRIFAPTLVELLAFAKEQEVAKPGEQN